ncbi:cobalt ECF transporter T component CbiQ [Methanogenium organophilum]|uniref:Cobalt ECF transporter T component CbiQ n=1 Tax=Methanogenium organophilum TaxID=2199 RepID=A0A9X9S6D8_METOG|nr:cobalt ECF transporter T component CbiQ [Methanogenium organophilum]WAI01730.1 cobalt ECF transporter T component CbiQ [Methanogenium organophilum]
MNYELFENIAQTSGLRDVHPAVKLILGLGCILISVSSNSFLTPVIIAVSISLITIVLGKIHLMFYLRLLFIPLGFALLSVLVIVFIRNSGDVLFSASVFGWLTLTITTGSVNEGMLILSRIFGGMCSLFFISLSTPVTEIFSLAKKCRLPDCFIELAMLIYRYIFILFEQAEMIYQAQVMRLGYMKRKGSVESFGCMAGSLFIHSWESGEKLLGAMDCRCYNGKYALLGEQGVFFGPALFLTILFLASLFRIMILSCNIQLFGGLIT